MQKTAPNETEQQRLAKRKLVKFMEYAIILAVTVVAVIALRNPIHKFPMVFYVLAIALDVIFVCHSTGVFALPRDVWKVMFELIQSCMLPMAMFMIVMYIGCFKKGGKAYTWLKPIRSELSIIAWILSLGHMAVYLNSYIPRILAGANINTNIMSAFVLALILLVLLLVLGVTSFNFLKKRMSTKTWIKIQKWAYPFWALVYVHLMLMLAPSAMRGGQAAIISVVVYTLSFGIYAVWRIARAVMDKKAAAEGATDTIPDVEEFQTFKAV